MNIFPELALGVCSQPKLLNETVTLVVVKLPK